MRLRILNIVAYGLPIIVAMVNLTLCGYILDEKESSVVRMIFNCSAILALAVIICTFKCYKRELPNLGTRFSAIATIILVVTLIFLSLTFSNMNQEDYIENEWIRGISLESLENFINSPQENIIYIGRNDCNECEKFEIQYSKLLKEYSEVAVAYYTNQDRDGENSEKMYNMLDALNIKKVPCLILVKNGEVLQQFNVEDFNAIDQWVKERNDVI